MLRALILLALLAPPAALAATFTVTKSADTADGACDADCSLREAIIAANTTSGSDRINVPAGTYTLTRAGAGEDEADTGDLDVAETAQIVGAGAGTTTVNAAGLDRVFQVTARKQRVDFAGLTIRGGLASGAGPLAYGGGVYGYGTYMVLNACTITDNEAHLGGGAYVETTNSEEGQASLTVTDSTVSNNRAVGANAFGGGLVIGYSSRGRFTNTAITGNSSAGTGGGAVCGTLGGLEIVGSVISGNTALNGGGVASQTNDQGSRGCLLRNTLLEGNTASQNGGATIGDTLKLVASVVRDNHATAAAGGGINNGPVTILDSEIYENTAATQGGGLAAGGLDLRRSAVYDNVAAKCGGGLFVGGAVIIENATISGNSVTSNGSGQNGILSGGGVCMNRFAPPISFSMTNVTLADNAAPESSPAGASGQAIACTNCMDRVHLRNTIITGSGATPQCQPPIGVGATARPVSEGGNLDSDGSCNLTEPSDQSDASGLSLGALAENGGPTKTRALTGGGVNPAVGAASDCPGTDQRGFVRAEPMCDAGAFDTLTPANPNAFSCGGSFDETLTQLGYVVDDVLPNAAADVGDMVFCLGGVAGEA